MTKRLILSLAALLLGTAIFAQSGGVKGTVVSRADKSPVQGAEVIVSAASNFIDKTVTDEQGNFSISLLPDGIYKLTIAADGFLLSEVNVTVNDGYVKNMFTLSLTPAQNVAEVDDASFAEFDMDDSGYQDSPTILFGQNDVFNNIAGFGFSSVRFRQRGYSTESQDIYVAGVRMNDAITGYTPYSLWSGLNEAMRTKTSVSGLESSDFGAGGYNGMVNIPGNASNVRKGWRGSVLSNSALYRLRLMLSYASGTLDNGWSYAFNASARLGGNDWVKGVYYRSFAYYGSVEKKFGDTHRVGFTFMAAPGQRGAQNASTQEVYDLMGDNMYNSNWGYQNGKVRNARVRKTHEPVAILKYDFTPSHKLSASATVLYRFGKNGYTALDWYDALDPRPDYYRNLPSYYWMADPDYNRQNMFKYAWAKESWMMDVPEITHLNWDRFYSVNTHNIINGQARSKYVVEERRVDQNDLNIALDAKWSPKDWVTVKGGISAKWNRTENYKKIGDLLGGDYYLNINQFAERDYAFSQTMVQYDLDYYAANGEAQVLRKGDKYGYDYYAQIRQAGAWASGNFRLGPVEASVAGRIGYHGYWRDGLVRSGLFPGLDEDGKPYEYMGEVIATYDSDGNVVTSKGRSAKLNFLTGGVKIGASYNFLGYNRVYANAGFFSDAPNFNQAFVSPRTRNTIVPDLKNTKTFSADLNYQYSHNGYDVRLTGFFTTITDQSDVMSFYDDAQNTFTNFAMSGIDQRHVGLELGFKLPLPFVDNLSLQGAVSYGSYVYTSNPRMYQTYDNSATVVPETYGVVIPYWKSHPVFAKKDGEFIRCDIPSAGGEVVTDAGGAPLFDDEGNPCYIVDHYQKHYVASTPQLATSLGLAWNWNYWFVDADLQYMTNSYLDMNPLYRTDMATAGPDGIITAKEVEYMTAQEKFGHALLLNASVGKSWYIKRKYQIGFSLQGRNLTNRKAVKTGGYEQTRLVDNTKSKSQYYKFDPKYFYMSGVNYMLNIYFRF